MATVFVGGGTPTLLPAGDLDRVLDAARSLFGLAADAEVTTEANPDSVDAAGLDALRAGGFTRISYGMQSAVPHVLGTLDRTHDPEGVPKAVAMAREAGFEQVSLDLIHGTPGESLADWRTSVEAALAMRPDHVSAYALIVEEGTALARRVARGELPAPDDDDVADKYLLADELLSAAGFDWYELSNWARTPQAACRHNLCTGRAPTGGAPGRARTRTSAGCAGGTSSTRPRTPPGWPTASAPRTLARCSTPRPGGSSGCCWRPGWRAGCRSTSWTRTDAQRCRTWSPTAWWRRVRPRCG